MQVRRHVGCSKLKAATRGFSWMDVTPPSDWDAPVLLPTPSDAVSWEAEEAAEAVSPPPRQRRRLCSIGDPQPADSCSSPAGVSASSSSSGGSSPPCAASEPVTRRRIRGKQAPPESPVGWHAPPEPELPPEWSEWSPESEASRDLERRRYHSFRYRMKQWMQAELSKVWDEGKADEELQRVWTTWRTATAAEKGRVVRRYCDWVEAPGRVRLWAERFWPADGEPGNPRKRCGWLYQTSVLLTYNGQWGELPPTLVPPGSPVEVVVAAVLAEPSAANVWREFLALAEEVRSRFPRADWAVSQELSTETWQSSGSIRFHMHMFIKNDSKMWAGSGAEFEFRGVEPHKRVGVGNLTAKATTSSSGLYYLLAPKFGRLRCEGSKVPHVGFPVNGEWIMALVAAHKMTVEDAREQVIQSGRGLVRRLADIDKLAQCRREAAIAARLAEVHRQLAATQVAFKVFPAIDAWRAEAERPALRRKKNSRSRGRLRAGENGVHQGDARAGTHAGAELLKLRALSRLAAAFPAATQGRTLR